MGQKSFVIFIVKQNVAEKNEVQGFKTILHII